MRYLLPKWPRALIVVTLTTVGAVGLDLANEGVAVTGNVPLGCFRSSFRGWGGATWVRFSSVPSPLSFVGYSETLAAGRTVASKHGYEIDPDQELVAQGAACGAAGFVGGFVNDGSLSKTSVADTAGQRTQMASLLNAGLVLLTMLLLAGLFEELPAAALGAVVIDAMVGPISFAGMKRYYSVNRPDVIFFMGAMLGILFLGIIQGIVIGVALSLLLLVARASRPGIRRLGRNRARTRISTLSDTAASRSSPASSSFAWTARPSSPMPTGSAMASGS
jgi:SulP family sulfate permease